MISRVSNLLSRKADLAAIQSLLRPNQSKNLQSLYHNLSIIQYFSTIHQRPRKEVSKPFIKKGDGIKKVPESTQKEPLIEKTKLSLEDWANQELAGKGQTLSLVNKGFRKLYKFDPSAKKLSYFDSLLYLQLARKSGADIISINYDQYVEEAFNILDKALTDPAYRKTLYDNNEYFKLLSFLQDYVPLNPNVHHAYNIDKFNDFVFKGGRDMQQLLHHFSVKFVHVNVTTGTSSTEKKQIARVIEGYLIGLKENDFSSFVLKAIEHDKFVISKDLEAWFICLGSSLVCLIQAKSHISPEFYSIAKWFLNTCTEISYLCSLSAQIGIKNVEIITLMEKEFENETEYAEVLLNSLTPINKSMMILTPERFNRVFFQISRLNVYQINYSVYVETIDAVTDFIAKRNHEFTIPQLKSVLYSIGYHSIYTPEIQSLYDRLLDANDMREKQTYNQFSQYLKSLLMSAMSTYSLQPGPVLDNIITYLVKDVRMHDPNSRFYDIATFTKIAMTIRRTECLNIEFWEAFYKSILLGYKADSNTKYGLVFILRTIELFAKDAESVEEYRDLYSIHTEFMKNYPDIYNSIMQIELTDLKSDEANNNRISSLQHQISKLLEQLNYKFTEEYFIDFSWVDFYLPEKNLVLEVQGPVHFLKPSYKKMNVATNFKMKCLEKLGYNVLSIPFNTVLAADVSLDYFLVQQIKQF